MNQLTKYFRSYLAITAILPMLLITACNSDGPVVERAEKVYYDTAQRRMKANNFFGDYLNDKPDLFDFLV